MTLVAAAQTERSGATPEVHVLADRCAGCQECVIRCPVGALSMDSERWIAQADSTLCVGCRQCVRTCPFSAIVVEGPLLVAPRAQEQSEHPEVLLGSTTEVRRGFSNLEEAMAEASRCLSCPDPTCVRGCPTHNDIPGFITAIARGDLGKAHEVLRRTTVLPDVCSRVCDQASQCEGACSWMLAGGEPVAIGKLERFVADHAPIPPVEVAETNPGISVAIVGSGPAAIGAAWVLREAGAAVEVFERDHKPGGLCDWGIPNFTLPASIAERPWRQLVEAGVELHLGHEVSATELEQLREAHDAVVLCHGASQPLRLSVPGADLEGVTDATTFLKVGQAVLEGEATMDELRSRVHLRELGEHRPRVLVLGAGNTAMDVARTARRLGMDPLCIDWLDEAYALARPDELAEARAEGVEVRFLRTLARLEGRDGHVGAAELAITTQARPDRRPTVVEGTTEIVPLDLVVMAMGYRIEPTFSSLLPSNPVRREASGVPDRQWSASGLLAAGATRPGRRPIGELSLGRERAVQLASLPVADGVWVAGDALVGPATVVEAMAQGRKVAASILAAGPRLLEASGDGRWRRVLVAYESQGGTTARAARAIGDELAARGAAVRVLPLAKVGIAEVAACDLLVMGAWVEGHVVAGVHPARAARAWLAGLGRLGAKHVALFCTYAVSPRKALAEWSSLVEQAGATVLATAAFHRRVLRPSVVTGAAHDFVGHLVALDLKELAATR
jgi:glutamate synthase (NADPH/NADH) small chain